MHRFDAIAPAEWVPRRTAALAVALLTLGGCTTLGGQGLGLPGTPRSGDGGKAGIIAALDGGLIGGSVGETLSEGERRRALEAEYRALENTPSGQKVAWSGEEAGRRGEVVAAQPFRVGSQDCRQYSQTVFTESGSRTARGSACREADGSWTLLR